MSPCVEAVFRFTAEQVRKVLADLPHWRFLKTHLPIDGMPFYDEIRCVANNGAPSAKPKMRARSVVRALTLVGLLLGFDLLLAGYTYA